jgi:hypothetical protein
VSNAPRWPPPLCYGLGRPGLSSAGRTTACKFRVNSVLLLVPIGPFTLALFAFLCCCEGVKALSSNAEPLHGALTLSGNAIMCLWLVNTNLKHIIKNTLKQFKFDLMMSMLNIAQHELKCPIIISLNKYENGRGL